MKIKRIVPITTVSNRDELEQTLQQHVEVLGMEVVMDRGWIATLADAHGHQLSIMMKDSTAPGNPDTSLFVDDVHQGYARACAVGLDIVHPLTREDWGVTRFFYCDAAGTVINVGMHS